MGLVPKLHDASCNGIDHFPNLPVCLPLVRAGLSVLDGAMAQTGVVWVTLHTACRDGSVRVQLELEMLHRMLNPSSKRHNWEEMPQQGLDAAGGLCGGSLGSL